jgi:hypothetical protein
MFGVVLDRIAGVGEGEDYGVPTGAGKRPWALTDILDFAIDRP